MPFFLLRNKRTIVGVRSAALLLKYVPDEDWSPTFEERVKRPFCCSTALSVKSVVPPNRKLILFYRSLSEILICSASNRKLILFYCSLSEILICSASNRKLILFYCSLSEILSCSASNRKLILFYCSLSEILICNAPNRKLILFYCSLSEILICSASNRTVILFYYSLSEILICNAPNRKLILIRNQSRIRNIQINKQEQQANSTIFLNPFSAECSQVDSSMLKIRRLHFWRNKSFGISWYLYSPESVLFAKI